MSLAIVGFLDWIAIGIDLFILLTVIGYLGLKYSKMRNCSLIIKEGKQLFWWRICLYTAIFSSWLIALFIFGIPHWIKFIFHPIFVASTTYTLLVSLPAYICKYAKQLGTCNCDLYEHTDFAPMIVLGIIGNLLFSLFTWNSSSSLILFNVLLSLSFIIFYFLPKKELKVKNIHETLLIRSSDEYINFISSNIDKNKILIIVGNSCKFCEVQVEEINSLPISFLQDHLRMFDVSDQNNVDEMVLFALNLEPPVKSVPILFVLHGGMCIEQKEGYVSSQDIKNFVGLEYSY